MHTFVILMCTAVSFVYIRNGGVFMTYADQILKIAHNNNGAVTTSQVTSAGIHREHLYNLVDKKVLERSARGVYILPEVFDDEMYNLQVRFKQGVFSHETALYLFELTDVTPSRYSMTFPLGYNTSKLKLVDINYYRTKNEFYKLGITTVKSHGGHDVHVYNMERTLCDILRTRNQAEIREVTDAFKMYTRLKSKNIPLLTRYAKIFHVDKKVRSYLEVLL